MRRPRRRLVVLIDGGCPLCRRTARLLHTLDWLDRLAFADGVDGTARERWAPGVDEAAMMQEMYVVDETGTRHAGYDGYLQLAAVVPVLWPFGVAGRLPGIRMAGRAAYRFIAARRVRRGRCADDGCATLPGMSPQHATVSRGSSKEAVASFRR